MTTTEYLATIPSACAEGRAWVLDNGIASDAEAWTRLQRPDWMLWLAENRGMKLDESKLRLFACDCAEQVLTLFEREYPEDPSPRQAIETARRFARGEANREELYAALAAARAAARAALAAALAAARAAARAAEAAARAAEAAARAAAEAAAGAAGDAALYAARAAAGAAALYAEDAAGDAALAAARAAAYQADKLRVYFPDPFEA